jgi:hypothetical protein
MSGAGPQGVQTMATTNQIAAFTVEILARLGLRYEDLPEGAQRVASDFDFGDLSYKDMHAYLTRHGLTAVVQTDWPAWA